VTVVAQGWKTVVGKIGAISGERIGTGISDPEMTDVAKT